VPEDRHEGERLADVGRMTLCYDSIGDPGHPTMLLVMGLGFQLVHWPDAFCEQLAARGFRVVRFDNRDAGRSTHLPGERYGLEDMADDTAGLLDALGVRRAHVVGASLGGMVAQLVAIRHPDRVSSLASLMSTTGRRGKGRTDLRVLRHMVGRRPRTAADAIERRVRVFAAVGSTGLAQDTAEIRRATALALSRDPDQRGGRRRQHAAVRAAGDRTDALRRVTAPTVVIHGTADRMCRPSGGIATARPFPALGWSSSRAWATTCRRGPGTDRRGDRRQRAQGGGDRVGQTLTPGHALLPPRTASAAVISRMTASGSWRSRRWVKRRTRKPASCSSLSRRRSASKPLGWRARCGRRARRSGRGRATAGRRDGRGRGRWPGRAAGPPTEEVERVVLQRAAGVRRPRIEGVQGGPQRPGPAPARVGGQQAVDVPDVQPADLGLAQRAAEHRGSEAARSSSVRAGLVQRRPSCSTASFGGQRAAAMDDDPGPSASVERGMVTWTGPLHQPSIPSHAPASDARAPRRSRTPAGPPTPASPAAARGGRGRRRRRGSEGASRPRHAPPPSSRQSEREQLSAGHHAALGRRQGRQRTRVAFSRLELEKATLVPHAAQRAATHSPGTPPDCDEMATRSRRRSP
jgi:pimeloyl-ACP methyl ester carboxylesterase